MKKNDIIKCLKANKDVTDYELVLTDKDSRELFYVLKHLEINRAVKVESQTAEIYVSDGEKTGFSTVTITAADNEKSLSKKIKDAVKKAKAAKNPYYPLPEKNEQVKDSKPKIENLNSIASKVAEAVFKADAYENGWINSTEIFVSQIKKEFMNSKGIHHVGYSFKIEVECIPTWSNKKEEYELYKFYETSSLDYDAITKEIDEILNLAKDRSNALTLNDVKLPNDLKVLVKNDMLEEIIENFKYDVSYRNVYTKQNHYSKKDVISNNKFNMTLKPVVKGACNSAKFDGHGVVLKNVNLIKDGKVINNWGDIRYGYYLGEKRITGNVPVIELKADGIDYEKEKHLLIETFSSPQLEETSGYWGGEVRLARYFDGKKYIPLTGFSISGNIYEDIKTVEFSKEETVSSNYKGPKYLIFKGIKLH